MRAESNPERAALLAKVAIPAVAIGLLAVYGGRDWIAHAFDGGPHPGTYTVWDLAATVGVDPHETVDDFSNLSMHIPGPVNITAMENGFLGGGGPCGILVWNPMTDVFKYIGVTGGFQFTAELNRSATPSAGPGSPLGGGDIWATVNGTSSFSPYVVFPGSSASASLRRWDGISASSATGIRVNPLNGKVYFGNFFSPGTGFPGQIVELDPATNGVRKWTVGNRPYFLELDAMGRVYATAVANPTLSLPDQIIRLDPSTVPSAVTRWTIPGGGLQGFISFGTPNFIAEDLEGQLWFTETGSSEIGRLNPVTNVFEEFAKPAVGGPHAIASSGIGPTLQAFFTEIGGTPSDVTSVLTRAAATPVTTVVVPPPPDMITPATSTAMPVDFTKPTGTVTITPATHDVMSSDPSGIDRFPFPTLDCAFVGDGACVDPTGMTRVLLTNTVWGSIEGSEDVFQLTSGIIIAEPIGQEEEKVTGGYMYSLSPAGVTGGFNVQRKEAGGVVTGELEYHNHASGKKIHLSEFTTLMCEDTNSDNKKDKCTFDGSGTVSSSPPGLPVTCHVEVHDNNEAGNKPPKDTFEIDCTDGEMTGGELKGGNIQIHK